MLLNLEVSQTVSNATYNTMVSIALHNNPDDTMESLKGTYLWHADRMSGWALGSVDESVLGDAVVHVRLVVRAVKILAIPASNSNQYKLRGS